MEGNIENIHKGTIKVLEETGVKFHHPEIIDLLKKNGIKVSDNTAYFKKEQVMKWISKAPSEFKIYARNSKYDMNIGGDCIEYASSNSGFPLVADADGNTRKAKFTDYLDFLKLVHQTPYFNLNGGVMVTPCDLKSEEMYPVMLYSTMVYSDKCIFGGLGGTREAEMTMDMLKIVFGGKEKLVEKPRILTIISPASPLQFDKTMLETMLTYVKHGQPIIVSPAVMAGTTGPITLAGTIVLSNAESLAGIVVAQMIREGTPVIYGSASSTADMRNGNFVIGAPESALCVKYCAQLAKKYNVPCRGGGTLNDAKSVSVQAGYESMMIMMTACQEKINFVLHSAGSLDTYTSMSIEKFIVDLEIIGIVKRFISGVKTDSDFLALDVIDEVKPGGQFLTTQHTYKNFKKEPFIPEISIRGVMRKGETPYKRFFTNVEREKQKMFESYQKPELSSDIKSKLIKYLKENNINSFIDTI